MSIKIFRSQSMAMTALVVFCLFLVSTTNAQASPAVQDVQTVYQEAIDLYNQGNFAGAIQQFNKVMTITQDATILTDTYFYLSVCYFYEGDSATAKEYVKMMLRNDPSREVSGAYPAEYRAIFKDAQKELKIEARQKPVEEPVVEEVPTYTTEPAVQKEKMNKGMIFIIGGVVLAGGAAAALLLLGDKTGSIDVSSTPAGASIFLDGSDTGQVTPALIEEVDPGAHDVGVRLDGYVNFSQNVNVEKKQTATVNANLTAHTITITNPDAGDLWVKGQNYNVTWNVSASGQVNVMLQPLGAANNPVSPSQRLMASRSNAVYNRTAASNGIPKGADSKLSFGSEEYRTSDLDPVMAPSRPDQTHPALQTVPQLRLHSPGEKKPMDIANMLIQLLRAGSVVKTLASNTANDGSHQVTAPKNVANAGNYKVRVSSAISNNVFGLSPLFWITAVGAIQCNSWPIFADILLDGSDTGFNTNKKLNNVPVGNRTVKYELDRFFDYTKTVNVTNGGLVRVFKLLDPCSFFEQFEGTGQGEPRYWSVKIGPATWANTGGVYRCTNATYWTSAVYWAGSAEFDNNYDWEARVKRSSGPDSFWRGVFFGGTNSHRDFFSVRFAENVFAVVYWTNFPSGGAWVKTPTFSPHIGKNWVDVKIKLRGKKFQIYFNDILHYTTTKSNVPARGSIGFVCAHDATSHATDYDNAKLQLTTASPSAPIKINISDPIDAAFSNIPITIPTITPYKHLIKK